VTSEWQDNEGERARRYYSITPAGQQTLAGFRSDWDQFSATVGGVLNHTRRPGRAAPAPDSVSAAAVTAPGTKGRRNDRHHH
jgi:DNA-binding PadR family transcriptional regulator